uniref:Uncharacterized protein n=1 Tax=Glossina palpalis gambiensis TaxID=67801 RepID=A0A1B0AQ67_9MUSC
MKIKNPSKLSQSSNNHGRIASDTAKIHFPTNVPPGNMIAIEICDWIRIDLTRLLYVNRSLIALLSISNLWKMKRCLFINRSVYCRQSTSITVR